jgi:hypothetical protein
MITDEAKLQIRLMTYKISNVKNSGNTLKQKFLPPLSNLHIIWHWAKRLILVGVVLVLLCVAFYWGVGVCLAIIAGFLIIRFLIRLTFRIIIMLVGILLFIALIVSLIILL